MKNFIPLVCLCILLSNCVNHKSIESRILLQVDSIQKLNTIEFKNEEGMYYSVCMQLINNTICADSFWLMSCSWEDNFILNSDSLRFYNRGCDNNYPLLKIIKGGEKLVFDGILQVFIEFNSEKEINCSIGFVVLRSKDYSDTLDFRKILFNKIERQKDIIWSKPFRISEM